MPDLGARRPPGRHVHAAQEILKRRLFDEIPRKTKVLTKSRSVPSSGVHRAAMGEPTAMSSCAIAAKQYRKRGQQRRCIAWHSRHDSKPKLWSEPHRGDASSRHDNAVQQVARSVGNCRIARFAVSSNNYWACAFLKPTALPNRIIGVLIGRSSRETLPPAKAS